MPTEPTNKVTIEMLNAHGPHDHGLQDPMTSGDTAYHKLSKSKVEAIPAEIALKHSISKLAKMTILDVGGYDGWILVQLQQEPKFNLAMCKLPKMNLVMSLL